MFAENPDRIFKEKRFLKDTVLRLNESHTVPLPDSFNEYYEIKSQDDSNGKRIHFRARNEDELSNNSNKGKSHFLKASSFFVFFLILAAFLSS